MGECHKDTEDSLKGSYRERSVCKSLKRVDIHESKLVRNELMYKYASGRGRALVYRRLVNTKR
jgi:hypothetical protein